MDELFSFKLLNLRRIMMGLLVILIVLGIWALFANFGSQGTINFRKEIFLFR